MNRNNFDAAVAPVVESRKDEETRCPSRPFDLVVALAPSHNPINHHYKDTLAATQQPSSALARTTAAAVALALLLVCAAFAVSDQLREARASAAAAAARAAVFRPYLVVPFAGEDTVDLPELIDARIDRSAAFPGLVDRFDPLAADLSGSSPHPPRVYVDASQPDTPQGLPGRGRRRRPPSRQRFGERFIPAGNEEAVEGPGQLLLGDDDERSGIIST